MKKHLINIVFFFSFFVHSTAQQKNTCTFATRQNRASMVKQLRVQVDTVIQLPLNSSTYTKYAGAYWAMELMLYRPGGYEKIIHVQILQLPLTDSGFQRDFLEMLYTLYPNQFARQLQSVWAQLGGDKVKAMALEYLARKNVFPEISRADHFFGSSYCRVYRERWKQKTKPLPLKQNFLDPSFLPGQTLLCSFQSINRNHPGYLMLRNEKGKWVTDTQGKPLRFPQLARSISNLPYYLTNGNTPQGLYKITGFDTSGNNWIGPTTNLQMVLPFENGPTEFFGMDTAYDAVYKNLLGPLAKYNSLAEAFEAGRLGRTEIIAHGTTIDPAFYKKQPYYPNTPSMGCLCSPELWNDRGERIYSAQSGWIQTMKKLAPPPGYLIVAEVRDL